MRRFRLSIVMALLVAITTVFAVTFTVSAQTNKLLEDNFDDETRSLMLYGNNASMAADGDATIVENGKLVFKNDDAEKNNRLVSLCTPNWSKLNYVSYEISFDLTLKSQFFAVIVGKDVNSGNWYNKDMVDMILFSGVVSSEKYFITNDVWEMSDLDSTNGYKEGIGAFTDTNVKITLNNGLLTCAVGENTITRQSLLNTETGVSFALFKDNGFSAGTMDGVKIDNLKINEYPQEGGGDGEKGGEDYGEATIDAANPKIDINMSGDNIAKLPTNKSNLFVPFLSGSETLNSTAYTLSMNISVKGYAVLLIGTQATKDNWFNKDLAHGIIFDGIGKRIIISKDYWNLSDVTDDVYFDLGRGIENLAVNITFDNGQIILTAGNITKILKSDLNKGGKLSIVTANIPDSAIYSADIQSFFKINNIKATSKLITKEDFFYDFDYATQENVDNTFVWGATEGTMANNTATVEGGALNLTTGETGQYKMSELRLGANGLTNYTVTMDIEMVEGYAYFATKQTAGISSMNFGYVMSFEGTSGMNNSMMYMKYPQYNTFQYTETYRALGTNKFTLRVVVSVDKTSVIVMQTGTTASEAYDNTKKPQTTASGDLNTQLQKTYNKYYELYNGFKGDFSIGILNNGTTDMGTMKIYNMDFKNGVPEDMFDMTEYYVKTGVMSTDPEITITPYNLGQYKDIKLNEEVEINLSEHFSVTNANFSDIAFKTTKGTIADGKLKLKADIAGEQTITVTGKIGELTQTLTIRLKITEDKSPGCIGCGTVLMGSGESIGILMAAIVAILATLTLIKFKKRSAK